MARTKSWGGLVSLPQATVMPDGVMPELGRAGLPASSHGDARWGVCVGVGEGGCRFSIDLDPCACSAEKDGEPNQEFALKPKTATWRH
jgi:hypothetical protein